MCYLRGSVSQVDWIPLSLVCSGCYSWQIYNITIQTVWSNSGITINNKLSVSQRMWDISSPNITLDTDIPIYRSDTWNDSLMIEYKYLPGKRIFQVSAAWKYCVRGREGVSWLLPLNYTNFLLKSDREREGRWGVNRSRFYCFISLLWAGRGRAGAGRPVPTSPQRGLVKNQIQNHYQDRISPLFLLPTPTFSTRILTQMGATTLPLLHIWPFLPLSVELLVSAPCRSVKHELNIPVIQSSSAWDAA